MGVRAGARLRDVAGSLIASGALGLYVAGLEPAATTLLLGVAAIALTGLATLRDEFLPLDTAALTAGGLALGVSVVAEPVLVSLAAALVGAQGIVIGTLLRHRAVSTAGAIGFAAAIVSLWWTTGTNALVIGAIAPYGATGADIAIAVFGVVLIALGWGMRSATRQSTWLAYGPGLGLIGKWLLSTQLEPNTDWATLGALAVGVVACVVGGSRRLGAPLVTGTAMIATTVLASAGRRLSEAPTWSWIAVGGVGLLVLAALVERSERPLLPTSDAGHGSLLESFLEEYE